MNDSLQTYLEIVIAVIVLVVLGMLLFYWKYSYIPDRSLFGTYSAIQTGACSPSGFQTLTQNCIPNSVTGNGCLIPNSNEQSFKPLTAIAACQAPAVKQQFESRNVDVCKSYLSQTEVSKWIFIESNQGNPNVIMPPLPLARPEGTCFESFPNTFRRVEKVCEATGTATGQNGQNNCVLIDPRTGVRELVPVGFKYQIFEACSDHNLTQCGTWQGCGTSRILTPNLNLSSSEPNELFAEKIIYSSQACKPAASEKSIQYSLDSEISTVCPFTSISNQFPTFKSLQTAVHEGLFGPDKKAFLHKNIVSPSAAINETSLYLTASQLPDSAIRNPFCINFGRVGYDNFEYCDEIANLVKNRAAIIATTSCEKASAYLTTGEWEPTQNIFVATPFNYKEIVFSEEKNTTAILYFIPTEKKNLYKIACRVGAYTDGFLLSGITARQFINDSAKVYYVAEQQLLRDALLEFSNSPNAGNSALVNPPIKQRYTNITVVLNNWDNFVDQIRDEKFYWVPMRLLVDSQTYAIAPLERDADLWEIEFAASHFPNNPLNFTNPLTMKITKFRNTVNKRNLTNCDMHCILSDNLKVAAPEIDKIALQREIQTMQN